MGNEDEGALVQIRPVLNGWILHTSPREESTYVFNDVNELAAFIVELYSEEENESRHDD